MATIINIVEFRWLLSDLVVAIINIGIRCCFCRCCCCIFTWCTVRTLWALIRCTWYNINSSLPFLFCVFFFFFGLCCVYYLIFFPGGRAFPLHIWMPTHDSWRLIFPIVLGAVSYATPATTPTAAVPHQNTNRSRLLLILLVYNAPMSQLVGLYPGSHARVTLHVVNLRLAQLINRRIGRLCWSQHPNSISAFIDCSNR